MSEDDEEEMAELFSFGSSDAAAAATSGSMDDAVMVEASSMTDATNNNNSSSNPVDVSLDSSESSSAAALLERGESTGSSGGDVLLPPITHRKNTNDSFMDYLDGVGSPEDAVLGGLLPSTASSYYSVSPSSPQRARQERQTAEYDQETQEMLDWLDEAPPTRDDLAYGNDGEDDDEDVVVFESPEGIADAPTTTLPPRALLAGASSSPGASKQKPVIPPPKPVEPTVVELPPVFDTLEEALASPQSSIGQIKSLAQQQQQHAKQPLDPTLRADLYCRLICGNKTAQQLQSSSLADAFLSWQQPVDEAQLPRWIPKAAAYCLQHIVLGQSSTSEEGKEEESPNNTKAPAVTKDDLIKLLAYHDSTRSSQGTSATTTTDGAQEGDTNAEAEVVADGLLPCVASLLLTAGIPLAAASVVLSQLQAQYMPLTVLALGHEQLAAAQSLHSHLYLLAAYHLPLLVVHLDRHVPGWYRPDTTSLSSSSPADEHHHPDNEPQQQGHVPLSWLVSFLSGQVPIHSDDDNTATPPLPQLPAAQILRLWDAQLLATAPPATSVCLRFFLTLAVLEQAADDLLLVTGDALQGQLRHAFVFQDEDNDDDEWFEKWMPAALALARATPQTVLEQLEQSEDEAVQTALQARQVRAEAALQARLQAEAAAHQAAQERKAAAARQRLTRARLVAFYRKHAPEKEANIDKILDSYGDKLSVLDNKLLLKYGESFHPALPPLPKRAVDSATTSVSSHRKQHSSLAGVKFLGLGRNKQSEASSAASSGIEEMGSEELVAAIREKRHLVSVLVAAQEVMPILCHTTASPSAAAADHHKAPHSTRLAAASASKPSAAVPLKYLLVDSRSEEAALEQGRFPKAVRLSAAAMDPEASFPNQKDNDNDDDDEERFESQRGAVHICIMGEGFSAIPTLYNQKTLSASLQAAMLQDEARTNHCALYFIKRGFPFVSVLDGGFCAAHAWLARHGPSCHPPIASPAHVLRDYDPQASVFGQMETLHHATATEKAQRQLAQLVETSLVAVTMMHAQTLEKSLASSSATTTTTTEKQPQQQQPPAKSSGLRLGAFFKGSGGGGGGAQAAASPPRQRQAAATTTDDLKLDDKSPEKSSTTTTTGGAPPGSSPQPPPTFRKFNPFARGGKSTEAEADETTPSGNTAAEADPKATVVALPPSTADRPASPPQALTAATTPVKDRTNSADNVNGTSHKKHIVLETPEKKPEQHPESAAATTPPRTKPTTTTAGSTGGVGLAASNILKRNPFRFGQAAAPGASPKPPPPPPSNHAAAASGNNSSSSHQKGHVRHKSTGFASLNNLRKSALGRMRSAPHNHADGNKAAATAHAPSQDEEGEESISFG